MSVSHSCTGLETEPHTLPLHATSTNLMTESRVLSGNDGSKQNGLDPGTSNIKSPGPPKG